MSLTAVFSFFLLALPSLLQALVVIEFAGTFPATPYTTRSEALAEISVNLQAYESIALSKQYSSVVVFPEYGLYGPNFATRDSVLPYLEVLPELNSIITCGTDSTLSMVACLAASLNSTVVVNMGELVWSNDTKSRLQFNVNVVVTSAGVLVAKYRKQHLYYEPAFDAGEGEYSTHPSTFHDSVSNLTYGLLTCNDLTFQATMASLVSVVDVVIGPAWWVNLPPLMSGTAYFSSLSLSYNTTVAVSGCGMGWYCSGTGVYSHGKALGNFYNSEFVKKTVLVEVEDSLEVPSTTMKNGSPLVTNLVKPSFLSFLHDDSSSNSTLLRFTPKSVGETFAYTVTSPLGLVCSVSGTIGALETDPVSLAVVSIRGLAPDLGFPQWEIEYCGVVACPADDCLSSLVLTSNVTLSEVNLSANFNLEKFRLFPILLESEGMVVPDTKAACDSVDLNKSGSLNCKSSSVAGTLSMSMLGMEIQ